MNRLLMILAAMLLVTALLVSGRKAPPSYVEWWNAKIARMPSTEAGSR